MNRKFLVFLIAFNLIALPAIFLAGRSRAVRAQKAPGADEFPDYGRMPAFRLTERSGAAVTEKDLEGSLWVADFIFTSCPNQCPMMTQKFSLLQKTLPPDVGLVSFSVDPKNDTPEKLKVYAEGHAQEGKRWLFLTGEKEEIVKILEALHLGNGDDPNMHSLRFVLLGPDRHILGYYNSEDSETLEKLKNDIAKWKAQNG